MHRFFLLPANYDAIAPAYSLMFADVDSYARQARYAAYVDYLTPLRCNMSAYGHTRHGLRCHATLITMLFFFAATPLLMFLSPLFRCFSALY